MDGWVQEYMLIFPSYKEHPLDYNMLHRNKTAIRYVIHGLEMLRMTVTGVQLLGDLGVLTVK